MFPLHGEAHNFFCSMREKPGTPLHKISLFFSPDEIYREASNVNISPGPDAYKLASSMVILRTIQSISSSPPVCAMPIEMSNEVVSRAQLEKNLARTKQCSREAALAGLKAAAATAVCTAIPTFASVRMLKWARINLSNQVAQTVIITYAAGMAYFIAGEKVVELARKHSLEAGNDTGFKC